MIEAAGHEVAVVDQAGLDRVSERHANHELAAARTGQLCGRQRDAKVVRRVARLGRREEVVHEVHVANEDGVPEGGVHRVGLSAADQRHPVTASEVPHLVAAGVDWAAPNAGWSTRGSRGYGPEAPCVTWLRGRRTLPVPRNARSASTCVSWPAAAVRDAFAGLDG